MGMEGEFTWEDACQEAAKGSEPIGVASQAGSRGKAGRRSSHTYHSQHRVPAPSPAPSTQVYSSKNILQISIKVVPRQWQAEITHNAECLRP
jgi:hypothetical protein